MEEDQDLKFVCKQCNKRFPCGKSLGGHMRSHVIANSAKMLEEKLPSLNGSGRDQQSRFGLRENPKKTWRVVDSISPLPQEKACKQCGKVFQTLKALCGHMACHSDKEKGGVNDDHSWSSESQKLEMDSDSEADEQIPKRDRSTIPKRYKKIVIKYTSTNHNNSVGSSSVSEIDSQEQEEVAKCLMMLSKDSGNWNGFNSIVDFSYNNSAVLETKSSSIDMKSCGKDGAFNVYNRDETPQPKKMEDRKKLKSSIDMVESQSSDSGYILGENKVDSDVPVNEFLAKQNLKSIKGYDYGNFALASKSGKQKRRNDPQLKTRSYKKAKISSLGAKKKYECLNCKKSFSSYQALSGHRRCHKKTNTNRESGYGTGENSLESDDGYNRANNKRASFKDYSSGKNVKVKKRKAHECPFCHRIFKSGQALGGHKRSHFIGDDSKVMNGDQNQAAKAEEAPDLHDLNLPAPVKDEEFMHWYISAHPFALSGDNNILTGFSSLV